MAITIRLDAPPDMENRLLFWLRAMLFHQIGSPPERVHLIGSPEFIPTLLPSTGNMICCGSLFTPEQESEWDARGWNTPDDPFRIIYTRLPSFRTVTTCLRRLAGLGDASELQVGTLIGEISYADWTSNLIVEARTDVTLTIGLSGPSSLGVDVYSQGKKRWRSLAFQSGHFGDHPPRVGDDEALIELLGDAVFYNSPSGIRSPFSSLNLLAALKRVLCRTSSQDQP